jgi:hypothetical protein
MIEKTIVIWDTQIEPIKFAVFKGDKSRLDGKYVNSMTISDTDSDELINMFFDPESGEDIAGLVDKFPLEEITSQTVVIVCGFLP